MGLLQWFDHLCEKTRKPEEILLMINTLQHQPRSKVLLSVLIYYFPLQQKLMKIMHCLPDRERLFFTAGAVTEIMVSYYLHIYLHFQIKSAETRHAVFARKQDLGSEEAFQANRRLTFVRKSCKLQAVSGVVHFNSKETFSPRTPEQEPACGTKGRCCPLL